jgi:hypothetical protein
MTQARFYSSATKQTTTTADPGTSGAVLSVVDSTVFASLDGQFPWTALINWGKPDQEVVNVTGRSSSGTSLTIVRGQDGSTGVAHPIGATVDHGVSARDFNEAGAHVGTSSGVHGLAGSVVGTTDVQTLTSKTLTTPTIGSFVNAPHTHADAASGGLIKSAPSLITNGGTLAATSTTPTDVPNLFVNLAAGGVYRFSAYFVYQGSTTTSTAKVCMGGTCTPSFVNYACVIQAGADGGTSTFAYPSINVGSTARSASVTSTSGVNLAVHITGHIAVTTAGTLTVQVGAGVATINVQSGGRFMLEQVA